jgi:lysine 6-dehydrogenase
VRDLFDGHDAVVSAVPYKHGVALAGAAVDTATHYVDFGGNPTVVKRQLTLDEDAGRAGVAIVPDCGLAPGVANVLLEGLIHRLGEGPIDSVQLRVGALPQTPRGALGYQLAFYPGGLINEYAEPCEVLEDGELVEVEPLTRFEEVAWDGWGPLEAFATAGGTSAMCRDYAGRVRAMEYKTLRYPGHGLVFRSLLEIGMFDEVAWPIGDVSIDPRSVLLKALGDNLPSGEPDVVLIRGWARRGAQVEGFEIEDVNDGSFSALARTTTFPATALIDLIVRGGLEFAGSRTMHQAVTDDQLLPEIEAVGIVPRPSSR